MSDYPIKSPRKLIEVALPLDAINEASAAEILVKVPAELNSLIKFGLRVSRIEGATNLRGNSLSRFCFQDYAHSCGAYHRVA